MRPLVEQLAEIFDAQAIGAIFTTRVIQDCEGCKPDHLGAKVIVPKYLESRSLAGSEDSNQLLTAIRRTAKNFVVGDGVENPYTWDKNISALSQAATTHLSSKEVLRLLDPENQWTYYKPLSSDAKLEDEIDALVGASYIGNIVKVYELLWSCPNVHRGSRFFGYPLQCACREGHKDIVIMLLEHGVTGLCDAPSDPYDLASFGTPLQSACSGGREDIVRLLLDPKHKVSVSDRRYYNAALRAAQGGHLDIVMLLWEKAAPKTYFKDNLGNLLMDASQHGRKEFVRTFIERESFTLPKFEFYLRVSLIPAAKQGHLDVVRLLLAQDAKGEYGGLWDPFFYASRQGFERVVRLLCENGANTTEWPNILYPAARAGQAHIVSFLLENRATLSPKGYGNHAVLSLRRAMKEGHEAVVRVLNHYGISLEGSRRTQH